MIVAKKKKKKKKKPMATQNISNMTIGVKNNNGHTKQIQGSLQQKWITNLSSTPLTEVTFGPQAEFHCGHQELPLWGVHNSI